MTGLRTSLYLVVTYAYSVRQSAVMVVGIRAP